MKIDYGVYNKVTSGERQGSASAVALPSVKGGLVWIKALIDNVGDVYIGGAGVTKADGTTDTTSGIELNPGDMIGPLPISNLNLLYMICDNTGDDLVYLVL
jgi:hypothetical protein